MHRRCGVKGLIYLEKLSGGAKPTLSFGTKGPHIDDLAALHRLVMDITLTGTTDNTGAAAVIAAKKFLYNSTLTLKYTDNEKFCDAMPLYYLDYLNSVHLDCLSIVPLRAVDKACGDSANISITYRLVVDFIPRKAQRRRDFEFSISELGTYTLKFGDHDRTGLTVSAIDVKTHADVVYRQRMPVGLRRQVAAFPVSGSGEDETRLDGRKLLIYALGSKTTGEVVTTEKNLRLYVDEELILDATELDGIDNIPETYGEDDYNPSTMSAAFSEFCPVFAPGKDFSVMELPHGKRVKTRLGTTGWGNAEGHWLQDSVLPQGSWQCLLKRIPNAEAMGPAEAAKFLERAVKRNRKEELDANVLRWLPREWHGPVNTPRACRAPRPVGHLQFGN